MPSRKYSSFLKTSCSQHIDPQSCVPNNRFSQFKFKMIRDKNEEKKELKLLNLVKQILNISPAIAHKFSTIIRAVAGATKIKLEPLL